MNSLFRKIFRIKMNTKVYLIGIGVIVLVPFVSKIDDMIVGTYEPVLSFGHGTHIDIPEEEMMGVNGNVWRTMDGEIFFKGVFDLFYPVGEVKMAFVNRDHPSESLVFDFPNIYMGSNGAVSLIILIFWSSAYNSYRKKGLVVEKRNTKLEEFKNQIYKKFDK